MQKLNLGSSDLAELAAEVFDRGGLISFAAMGSSMQPTLKDGDLLTAAPEDPASINSGDLIMYRTAEDRAAVHRVSDVSRISSHSEVILSSDSSPDVLYRISIEQVMGKIISASRDGRAIRIDSIASDEPQTASVRLYAGFRSAIRKAAARVFSTASGFRLYRKPYAAILRPLVKYEIHPAEQYSGNTGTQSRWDWLDAYLFGRKIGSAQLIRFEQGTAFGEFPWLFSMRVKTLFRGGGVGRGLTTLAVSGAEASGARVIGLLVDETNYRAVKLYESMGFEIIPFDNVNSDLRDRMGSGKAVMLRDSRNNS
ncbi:MAG: GNAT family N-acetyltransferase [Candidatus Fermentibacteria bacterium]